MPLTGTPGRLSQKAGISFAIAMSSAKSGRIPGDRRSCQERGGRHEGQDDGVGPCAANGAPGLGDHFGHAALGIGLSQAGSGHDHANEVGAILGRHVGVSEAGGDDPRGLRADIRLDRVGRAAIRAKQPVELERQQRLGGRSARREGVARGLRRCRARCTQGQRRSNEDRQPPDENAVDAVTEFDLVRGGGVPGRPQPAGEIASERKARDGGEQKPESRQ